MSLTQSLYSLTSKIPTCLISTVEDSVPLATLCPLSQLQLLMYLVVLQDSLVELQVDFHQEAVLVVQVDSLPVVVEGFNHCQDKILLQGLL